VFLLLLGFFGVLISFRFFWVSHHVADPLLLVPVTETQYIGYCFDIILHLVTDQVSGDAIGCGQYDACFC
jgi:hypothetical protein